MILVLDISDVFCKFPYYIRVRNVFFLGSHGHEQMILNQPGNQITFAFGKAMRPAELDGISCSEFAMVTATTFGNIMKNSSQIDNIAAAETLEHRADHWKIFGKTGFLKAVQITQ